MNIPKPNGKIHPVAEIFPMMTEEELNDLADDIKANGLHHQIVLDETGTLIDGRNRLEACRRAGIAASYTLLKGVDPIFFIISQNIKRRHLTQGQRAIIVAKCMIPEESTRKQADLTGVSQPSIGKASIILKYAPELADSVLAGSSLNDAYKTAQERKASACSTVSQMNKLQADAPDLAELVSEERMALSEALAAQRERQEKLERDRKVATQMLCQLVMILKPRALTIQDKAKDLTQYVDFETTSEDLSRESLIECIKVFQEIINQRLNS